MKKILREVLKFKSEYFVTVLFITLFICSIKVLQFNDINNIIFNIVLLVCIPSSFIGIRYSRRLIYEVWKEVLNDEN